MLQLAARRMTTEEWVGACNQAADFWTHVRDRPAERVWLSQQGGSFLAAGPPSVLRATTDSEVYVLRLFDAAGPLGHEAQEAWRRHDAVEGNWHAWVLQLWAAPPVQLQALAHSMRVLLQARPHAPVTNRDVLLTWEAAARRTDGAAVTLPEIVHNSRSEQDYCPSLAQEVILRAFGGHGMTRDIIELANRL